MSTLSSKKLLIHKNSMGVWLAFLFFFFPKKNQREQCLSQCQGEWFSLFFLSYRCVLGFAATWRRYRNPWSFRNGRLSRALVRLVFLATDCLVATGFLVIEYVLLRSLSPGRPSENCDLTKKNGDLIWLVVWNHGILWLSIQLGISSSQLTFTPSFFQRGRSTTNQVWFHSISIDLFIDR